MDKTIETARAAKLRQENQDALRARIDGKTCLTKIDSIDQTFSEEWRSLGKNQVDALKARAEIQFRKLAKVLPDLKSVEVRSDPEAPVRFILNTGQAVELEKRRVEPDA